MTLTAHGERWGRPPEEDSVRDRLARGMTQNCARRNHSHCRGRVSARRGQAPIDAASCTCSCHPVNRKVFKP